jgi:hypothetical protein
VNERGEETRNRKEREKKKECAAPFYKLYAFVRDF